MAQQRRRGSRRRRRGRFSGLYKALSIVAALAAVLVACVVFFRVQTVTVEGNARYTREEIVAASGIQQGDNLMALSKARVASLIRTSLPYVESVFIRRVLPDGVLLTVKERVAAASVEGTGGRWLISAQGKVLEQAGEERVIEIVGLRATAPYPGGTLQVEEESRRTLEYVLALLTALEEQGLLAQCGALDCTPATYLTLTWDIYTLRLPRGGDYPYMLRLLAQVMASEEMPKNEPGTLDFTVQDGEVYFRRAH